MNKKILMFMFLSMFMLSMSFGALTDNDVQFATFNDADLTGNDPNDVTGTGNTMVNNGATTGVAGLIDEAFSFDGNNDYMTLSKPVDPTPTANMTISLWIKTSTSCATKECYLITNDLSGSPDFTIGIGNTAIGGNKIFFASNNFVNIITSTSTVNDNGWHHIVATKNLANGSLWLDGVYQGSFTNAASWTTGQNWEMANFRQTAGYYYTGLIDAYGVWDRTLTETEITDLYQSGAGLEYPFVLPITTPIIQTNLTNGTWFNTNNINVLVNTTQSANVTYSLDGGSFISLYNNSFGDVLSLTSLSDAQHNLTFNATNINGSSQFYNNFNVDTTLPVINDILHAEINSYLLNISQNVSCSDSNLKTCNITFTPDGNTVLVNQTDIYNFTYNGNQTYNILAEDQAGNIVNQSGVILVNPSFNITINNATGSQITDYYLGGILINDTATYNIYDFGLGISKLEFSKLGFTTGNITINLTNTSRTNYNLTIPFAKLIITMYDVTDYSEIFGNDFTIEIIGGSYSKQFSIVNSSNITIIDPDITPDKYTALVSSANYSTTFVEFEFSNQEELNLDIYLTPKAVVGETITSVIVKTLDSSKDTIGNIPTKQYVWDSSTGQYVLLNEKTTNSYGQTSYPVFLDTKLYKFCALYDGALTCNSDVYIDESTLEILIEINTLQLIPIDTESIYKYDFPYSLTNTSLGGNLQEINFIWDNDKQDISSYCLEIYFLNISKETLIDSACTTSHSGGLSFQINKTENESYIAKAQIYYNGQKKLLDKLILPKTGGELAEELIFYGYYKIIGLIFVFGSIAIGLMPQVRTPLLSHGLLILASISIYAFFKGYGGIEVVGLIIILNGGAIFFLSKLNETGSDKEKGYKAITIVLTIFFGLLALTSMLQVMDSQGNLDDRGEEMLNYLTGADGTNSTNEQMSTLDTKILKLENEIEGLEVGESSIFDIVFIKSINFFKLTWELLKSMLFLPNTILFLVGLDYIVIVSKLGYIIGLIMNVFIVSYLIQRIFGK